MTLHDQQIPNTEASLEHEFERSVHSKAEIWQMGITELSGILGEKPNFNVGYPEILELKKRVFNGEHHTDSTTDEGQVVTPVEVQRIPADRISSIVRKFIAEQATPATHVKPIIEQDSIAQDVPTTEDSVNTSSAKNDSDYDKYLMGLFDLEDAVKANEVAIANMEAVSSGRAPEAEYEFTGTYADESSESKESGSEEPIEEPNVLSHNETIPTLENADNEIPAEVQSEVEDSENTDIQETTHSPEVVTIPDTIVDYFNSEVVRYINDYVNIHKTVEGVFGTKDEPSERFNEINRTLRNMIIEASLDEQGNSNRAFAEVIGARINKALIHVYKEASSRHTHSEQPQQVEEVSETPQIAEAPKPEISEINEQEQREIEGAQDLFSAYLKEVESKKIKEDSLENRGNFAVRHTHDMLVKATEGDRSMSAKELYDESVFKSIIHRYLRVVAEDGFKETSIAQERDELVNQFIQDHARQINENIARIDTHYRKAGKGILGRLSSRLMSRFAR
jgi:hypothetical protein